MDSKNLPLPTFLIVGAAKSGTTSLIHGLSAHPEVFAPTDELHYFSRRFEEGLDAYRSCFVGWTSEAIVGESSPEYMFQPEVVPRIAAELPDAKLVVILREPVARAYSQYWHNRTRGHEPLSFADALLAEPERSTHNNPRRAAQHAYAGRSRYVDQIERLREFYSADRIHVVLTEELRSSRAQVLGGVLAFLGAENPDASQLPELEKNRFVTFRSQRARKIIRKLPGPVRTVAARANIKYENYEKIDPAVQAELALQFEEPNRRLAAFTDLDLSVWNSAS